MASKTVVVVVAMLMTACISTGTKLESNDLEAIKSGKMTSAQVLDKYGSPRSKMTMPSACKGKPGEMMVYSRAEPGIVEDKYTTVALMFDPSGRYCDMMVNESTRGWTH